MASPLGVARPKIIRNAGIGTEKVDRRAGAAAQGFDPTTEHVQGVTTRIEVHASSGSRGRCCIGELVSLGRPLRPVRARDPCALRLRDADRQSVIEVHALDRWAEDSIRWALLDFRADGCETDRSAYMPTTAAHMAARGLFPELLSARTLASS